MKRILCTLLLAGGMAFGQLPLPYPIFDQDAVHEIRVTFANEDWYQVLTDNYDGVRAENPYFPASLEWGQNKFETIGIRFKGNSTYSASRGQKKPFRIKLNEFVKGQKIEGIGSFSLSNAWNDPSFVREKLYYEMAAAIGLKAPRSNFAALYINGKYWGLYVLTEVINSDFLKNYYGKGDDEGNLYKGNIGASFAYLGEDKEAYRAVWEKQSNEEADDWTDLIELCKLISETPSSELRAKLEPIMDIDSVLTALALDNATVNLDSYVGMGQNFNVYRRASDKRWIWIPWDPSLAFGALSQGQTIDGMKTLALEWVNTGGGFAGGGNPGGGAPPGGFPGGGNPPPGGFPGGGFPGGGGAGNPGGAQQVGRPLATKLWEVPEFKERYRQIYQQLMNKAFHADRVIARANALRDMIRPWVELDEQKLVTQEQFDNAMSADATGTAGGGGQGGPQGGGQGGANLGGIPGLEPFINARTAFISETLATLPPSQMAVVASTGSLEFTQTGSTAPGAQTVSLTLNGTEVTAFYALTSATDSGGNWLTVTPAGGAVNGSFKVTATGKLDPGTYNGHVKAWVPGAVNSPLEIGVTLTVQ